MSIDSKIRSLKKDVKKKPNNNKIKKYIADTPEDYGVLPLGDEFSVCSKCGKEFKQEYINSKNMYTNFPYCRECRFKNKKKKNNKLKLIEIDFGDYRPYPWQLKAHIAFEKHRYLVLPCANRVGKDRFSIMAGILYFLQCLNENRHVNDVDMVPAVHWWLIAPVEENNKQIWMELKQFFPKDLIAKISDAETTIETLGGGLISLLSAYDPQKLVGVGLDLVTITEASRVRDLDETWVNLEGRLSSPGRGLLKDRGKSNMGAGKAIINGSPLKKDFFYKMFLWGQKKSDTYSSAWHSITVPYYENPTLKAGFEELIEVANGIMITKWEDLCNRTNPDKIKRNWLGEFPVSNQGQVFKLFEEKCIVDLFSGEYQSYSNEKRKEKVEEWKKYDNTHQYLLGWDFATGSSGDEPALVIADKTDFRLVDAISLYGLNDEEQINTISYYSKMYGRCPCAFSRTGNETLVGKLEKNGVAEIVLDERGSGKVNLIRTLDNVIQQSYFKMLIDGSNIMNKVRDQIIDYTEYNGKYSNNIMENDDFVSAISFCFYDFDKISYDIPYIGYSEVISINHESGSNYHDRII